MVRDKDYVKNVFLHHLKKKSYLCGGFRQSTIMQTVQLKYDIIAWVTGLTDKKLIGKLHKWIEEQEDTEKKEYEQLKNAFLNSSKLSMAQQIGKHLS